MKTSEMKDSKFLRKEDVGAGMLFTVAGIEQHNVAKQGADQELRYCLTFTESEKPLVLNSTNIQLCEAIFKSDDTDVWIGKKIVLYTDPTVSYGGKIVGGIRVRAPRIAKPAVAAKPAAVAAPALRRTAVAQVKVEADPDEYGTVDGEDVTDDIPF